MIRLAAATLAVVVVVFPLAVLPAAPVTWLAVPAAALGVVGAVGLSVAFATGGAALALIAYAAALAIERPAVDPLTAIVFGATLVVLLALVHFAALTDGAALGSGVVAAEIRRWLAIVAAGVVAAVALTLGGSALAPALQRGPLPLAVGAAALGAVVAGAGVILLVGGRKD